MRWFFIGLLLASACDSPRHQGRTLQSWVHDLDSELAHERANALEALGTAARGVSPLPMSIRRTLPKIAQALGDPDPAVQEQARMALIAVGIPSRDVLEEAMLRPQPTVRTQAAAALVALEATHEKAARVLVETMLNPAYPELAALARDELLDLGAFAVAPLAERMPERKVIETVADLGPAGREMSDELLRLAREDTDLATRLAAMKAYARVVEASVALSTLDELRMDEDIRFARSAGALMQRYEAP